MFVRHNSICNQWMMLVLVMLLVVVVVVAVGTSSSQLLCFSVAWLELRLHLAVIGCCRWYVFPNGLSPKDLERQLLDNHLIIRDDKPCWDTTGTQSTAAFCAHARYEMVWVQTKTSQRHWTPEKKKRWARPKSKWAKRRQTFPLPLNTRDFVPSMAPPRSTVTVGAPASARSISRALHTAAISAWQASSSCSCGHDKIAVLSPGFSEFLLHLERETTLCFCWNLVVQQNHHVVDPHLKVSKRKESRWSKPRWGC